MGIIEDLRNRIVALNEQLENGTIIKQILWDNEAYIVDLNAQGQLYEQGITSLGIKISDYLPYAPLTIEIKQAKGQPTDRVTLRDEGDFESSFFLEVGNEQFEIKAADFKTEQLMRDYGNEILGLTDENLAVVIWQYIFPDLMKTVKQIAHGTN